MVFGKVDEFLADWDKRWTECCIGEDEDLKNQLLAEKEKFLKDLVDNVQDQMSKFSTEGGGAKINEGVINSSGIGAGVENSRDVQRNVKPSPSYPNLSPMSSSSSSAPVVSQPLQVVKVDLSWVGEVAKEEDFNLWCEGFEKKVKTFLGHVQLSDADRFYDTLDTAIYMAAEKGKFHRMMRDIQRLNAAKYSGPVLLEELKKLYNHHSAVDRHKAKQWLEKIKRNPKESLYKALLRLERCLQNCAKYEFFPVNEQKNEALKRICVSAEWSQIWFQASVLEESGKDVKDWKNDSSRLGMDSYYFSTLQTLAYKLADTSECTFVKEKENTQYANLLKKYKALNKEKNDWKKSKPFVKPVVDEVAMQGISSGKGAGNQRLGGDAKKKRVCWICGKEDHLANRCDKRKFGKDNSFGKGQPSK